MPSTLEATRHAAAQVIAARPLACIIDLWEAVKAVGGSDPALQEAALDVLCEARGGCSCDCDDQYCDGGYYKPGQ